MSGIQTERLGEHPEKTGRPATWWQGLAVAHGEQALSNAAPKRKRVPVQRSGRTGPAQAEAMDAQRCCR